MEVSVIACRKCVLKASAKRCGVGECSLDRSKTFAIGVDYSILRSILLYLCENRERCPRGALNTSDLTNDQSSHQLTHAATHDDMNSPERRGAPAEGSTSELLKRARPAAAVGYLYRYLRRDHEQQRRARPSSSSVQNLVASKSSRCGGIKWS